MSVEITQDEINVKEELNKNKQRYGIKGKQLLEAESVDKARALIGADRKNLLINGGFDIWQRGTNFTQSTGYTADRWAHHGSHNILTESTADGIKLTLDSAVPTFSHLDTIFEFSDMTNLLGATVTLSFNVRSNTNVGHTVTIYENWTRTSQIPNTFHSSGYDVTTEWTTITKTFKMPTAHIAPYFVVSPINDIENLGIGNWIELANVQLEIGDQATEFEQRTIGEEIALCERYYQKSYDIGTRPGVATQLGSLREGPTRNIVSETVGARFKRRMRVVPTVTLYSPLTGASGVIANNGNKSAVANHTGETGFAYVGITSGNINAETLYHYTADAEL